jgi:uncharacterized protein YjdB/regulation of enolase protein 1 (concanavalin A-like superfamily)
MRWEQVGNEIVFQWKEFRRYLATPESVSFQIRLNTSNGQIVIIYDGSTNVATSIDRIPQVGLRGSTNADYNARRLTTSFPDSSPAWNDTGAASSNAHNVRFTSVSPAAFPTSGLTFTWSLPTDAVDWCNLQFPASGSIAEGGSFTAYGQAYEPGVTEAPGQGAGLNAWIGYSTTNTDPATWANWVVAPFNTQDGNNDEFIGMFTPPGAGTYYYAFRYQLNGGPFRYGGYSPPPGGGFWDGVNFVSGVLTVNCSATVSSFPYLEDFEAGTGNWVPQSITGTEGWVRGTPNKTGITTANSGANAMVTSSLTANYGNSQTFALRSPCFDLSSFTCAPVLSFWMNMITEANWDAMDVEYSTDGGSTWTKLGVAGATWYNNTSASGPISQPKFSSTTSGVGTGWQQRSIQLPVVLAGQPNVRLRFRFGSDSSTGYAGFAIDDIEIKASIADASVSNLTLPATACSLTTNETVTVQVNNVTCPAIPAGAASVLLSWTGSASGNATLNNTGAIAAGGNEVLTFTGVDLSADGAYNFTATVTYTGDPVAGNNSAMGSTTNYAVPVVTAAATATTICAGESTDLSASIAPAPMSVTATIGAGTSSESLATPYRRNWGGTKLQLLYTATELTAAGLGNGSEITALAFNVTLVGANIGPNFSISAKLTSTASLVSAFESGLTTVYGPTAGGTPVLGWNSYTLATPIVWDGASNLVVETCFHNNDAGISGGVSNVQSSTATNLARVLAQDNVTACPTGTGSSSSNRANIRLTFSPTLTYAWTSDPAGFTSAVEDPGAVMPATTTTYYVEITDANNCSSQSSVTVTVNPSVSAGTISGTTPLCAGDTPAFTSDGTAGGAWSSNNTGVAAVDEITGVVTAIAQGMATITYTVSAGCGAPVSATYVVTVTLCATCPDLTAAAPVAQVTNSTCATFGGTPSGGLISAPAGSCPAGSTLQYSTDGGANWGTALPTYNQSGPAQTIETRCNCDATPATSSPVSSVTTVPGTCPICPDLTAAAPVAQVTNSTCATFGGTPSGGSISAPAGSCPAGSTLQYSTDGGANWSTALPTYNQSGPAQTIETRCNCDATPATSSPVSSVTTVPGACPLCPDLTAAAPVAQVTNSTCTTVGGTPSGGVISAPAGSCPAGSTLQYSTDAGANWSTALPTYNQSGPAQTIQTRCNCDATPATSSPVSSVTTIPGTCPTCPELRISQVYGGGGNTYTHDFVELFNAGSTPVSLNGLSIQYASATGTGNFGSSTTQLTELPNVMVQPGQYYLIQQATGTVTTPLPTPDHIDPTPINLAATAGKVALVNSATTLGCNGGSTPCNAAQLALIIDLVGYGGANFFEGAGAAPAPSNTTAILRGNNGFTDTNNNSTDFTAGTPNPRNSASPMNAGGLVLTVTDNVCPSTSGTISATGCGVGTVVEYATNAAGPWSMTAPTYTVTAFTVYVRCRNTTTDCSGPIVSGTTAPTPCCPDLTAAAPVAQVTNSTCATFGGTPSGGLISAPAGSCPAGSTLQYSTDGGANWSTALPTYNQSGPAQTIETRCNCDATPATSSPTSSVTTVPGACPLCPDLTAAAPVAQVTNSTCATFGGTPSGGLISAPAGSCPAGSTLQYSTDGGANWGTTLPTYNQSGPAQTILTRCNCDATPATSSPVSSVTTVPGTCPPANDPCSAPIETIVCDDSKTVSLSGSGIWSPASCGFSTPGTEKVYSFTATTTGVHNLQVTSTNGGGYINYFIKAASGGCSSSGWTCIDDIFSPSTVSMGTLTAGTTYYILLDAENTSSIMHTFQINCPVDPCSAPIETIVCDDSKTVSLSGSGIWSPASCGFSTPGTEKVYSFTATTTGVHNLQVTSTNGGGYINYFIKAASGGCSSSGWTCIDDIFSPSTVSMGTLTAGTTYYILLDAENTSSIMHTFQINCPVACPSFSGAPANVSITDSSCGSGCTISGGVINAPAGTPCPMGSTLQYSTDGGTNWSATLPIYNQTGPAQSIQTRCNCDADTDISSPASAAVTTVPGTCPMPSINCPTTQTLVLGTNCKTVLPDYISLATIGNNCGIQGVAQSPEAGTPVSGAGNMTVTITVTDLSGNSAQCSFTVTKVDNTAPMITCPATQTLVLGDDCRAALPDYRSMAAASDSCGIQGIAQTPMPGTIVMGADSLTVTLTATDLNGNSTSCSFRVNKVDNTPPNISCPGTQTLVLGDDCRAALPDYRSMAAASDSCGIQGIAQTPMPGTIVMGADSLTVTLTATDLNGNSTSCSFRVNKVDNTPPSISCPATQTLVLGDDCRAALPDYRSMAAASDSCGILGIAQTPMPGTIVMGADSLTVTLTATDLNGNSTSCSFRVNKVDNTPPNISCPGTQTLVLGDDCRAALPDYRSMAAASDSCGILGMTQTPMPGTIVMGADSLTVTLTATDLNGNSTSCSFRVNKVDNTPPSISCPATQTLVLGDDCRAALPDYRSMAAASDSCGILSMTQTPMPGTIVMGAGSTTVTLTATDLNGNSTSCSFTVNRVDNTPPTVQCFNQTITFNGENSILLNIGDLVEASDSCGVDNIALSPAGISCEQLGQTVPVTVTVTDVNNLTATCTSNITVTGLPCGWSQQPDGVNCANGNSIAYNPTNGVWTATSTNCFYGSAFTADQLAFAQRTLCGDGSITAQVTDISGTSLGWAGVVMRESNAAGAKKAQLMTNLSTLSRREFRTTTNGQAFPQQFPSQNRYWLRLVRAGNQFSMYVSANGLAWYFVGAQNVPMNSCIQVGLVATNYQQSSTVTATFANVSFTGSNVPPLVGASTPLSTLEPATNASTPLSTNNEQRSTDFQVYPNPTSGELNVNLAQYAGRAVRLEVYSLTGQLLRFVEIDEVQTTVERLDLSGFAGGLYLVKVKSDGLPDVTKRVVLQRE